MERKFYVENFLYRKNFFAEKILLKIYFYAENVCYKKKKSFLNIYSFCKKKNLIIKNIFVKTLL